MNILKRITLILSICCIAFPARAMDNGDGNPGWAGSMWNKVCEEAPAVCFSLGVGIAGMLLYGLYEVSTKRAPEMDPSDDMHPDHEEWSLNNIKRSTAISSDDIQPYLAWETQFLDGNREDIVDTLFKRRQIFANRMWEKINSTCQSNDLLWKEAEQIIRDNIKKAIKFELTKVSIKEIQHVIPAIIALTMKQSNVDKDTGKFIATQLIPEIVRGKLALIKKCFPDISRVELQQLQQRIIFNINSTIASSPSMQAAKITNIE